MYTLPSVQRRASLDDALSNFKSHPSSAKELFDNASSYFPTQMQLFQYYDKYSRFNYELGRRETWPETVDRSVSFLKELSYNKLNPLVYDTIRQSILAMDVMPSMRLLAMAGPAARRSNITIYNCAAMGVDCIDSFVEALIISMAGCGVGFSVEGQFVKKLPKIKSPRFLRSPNSVPTHIIGDSAEGWAIALRTGLEHWFEGWDVEFDYSQVRPAGAPLKIKGGQSSGPLALFDMLNAIRSIIFAQSGSYLRSIDAHDIMCHVGNAAVSGGTRRTAMLSLFDYDDELMLNAKSGTFGSQRWNANNSAVWTPELTRAQFDHQFMTMHISNNGEPGIFNRPAISRTMPERRRSNSVMITNPCSEIILRPNQFCNLSATVARSDDTPETLAEKVKVATIIGTIQSMATYFPGLRSIWKENCEEERLLGVDITGQMDCTVVQDPEIQRSLKQVAIRTNQEYVQLLDINSSAAITCVKPSGNTSVLTNCSSGIHARWAPYYIRRVTLSPSSPIFKVLRSSGIPMEPRFGSTEENANAWVASFPIKSPDGAVTRNDRTAVQQCEYWLSVKQNWTEHTPSVTINYSPSELEELMDWVWEHKSVLSGMSFFPTSDASYAQLPYEEITEERYNELISSFPTIDFSRIVEFEKRDETMVAQELACSSGRCTV